MMKRIESPPPSPLLSSFRDVVRGQIDMQMSSSVTYVTFWRVYASVDGIARAVMMKCGRVE